MVSDGMIFKEKLMEYKYMLSPIAVGTKQLKTRLIHSTSYGMNLGMGPNKISVEEMFARATRYYLAVSEAGAALVNFSGASFPDSEGKQSMQMGLSYLDPEINAGFRKLIGVLHEHDTLCVSNLKLEPEEYNICWLDDWDELVIRGDYAGHFRNKPTCPLERLEMIIDDYGKQAKQLKDIGFDGINFHMSYHSSFMCTALSPVFNKRTDKYGGKTLKERAAFPLAVLQRVRETCGKDFLIEIQMSAHEEEPGYTVEDWLEFCELAQGLFDIIQIRGFDGSYTHVSSLNSTRDDPHTLQFAVAFKARGLKGLTAPVGGFNLPDVIEKSIAEGKTDLVAMARTWLADQEYAKKIRENRTEDIIPCLGCMGKCDFPSCAVNPKHGLVRMPDLFAPAGAPKRVAVIGGGPAGIQAALTAEERGHTVTLFEKDSTLGGQVRFSQYADFKWRLDEYRQWMLRQVQKRGIDVHLNTTATPELIATGNYDAIILAVGSQPKKLPVKGAELPGAYNVDNVWAAEPELGHRVVIVGGGASGREVALYLARKGHEVTMLTRKQEIYTDNCHCIWGEVEQYLKEPNLHVVNFAATKEIGDGYVIYDKTHRPEVPLTYHYVLNRLDDEIQKLKDPIEGLIYAEYPNPEAVSFRGPEEPQDETVYQVVTERVEFDSIVLTGGRRPPVEELASYVGLAPNVYVVGDAIAPGSVQEATLTGFAAAMAL